MKSEFLELAESLTMEKVDINITSEKKQFSSKEIKRLVEQMQSD